MRKVILVVLSVIMLVSFVGCGAGTENSDNTITSSPQSAKPEETTGATSVPTQAPTNAPSATANPVPGGTLYQLVDEDQKRAGQMNSYIIHTDNNKLMIFDGGYERNIENIVELAKEITGQEVPEVEAWFHSHLHSDHVDAFIALMDSDVPALQVKKVYYNLPSREYVDKHEGTEKYDAFMAALAKLPAENCITVKEDDVITVDGLTVEVLLTVDEKANVLAGGVAINESSAIFRLTIGGQRVLFLGDAYETSGSRLRAKYKKNLDGLQAEVVQMAHHGSQGVQKELYKMIAPKACLWPTPDWLWDNDPGTGYNTGSWETITLNSYLTNICGVKHHFIAKDGMQKLVFPLDLS